VIDLNDLQSIPLPSEAVFSPQLWRPWTSKVSDLPTTKSAGGVPEENIHFKTTHPTWWQSLPKSENIVVVLLLSLRIYGVVHGCERLPKSVGGALEEGIILQRDLPNLQPKFAEM